MSWSDIAQAAAATAQASASLAAPALDSRRAWKYTKKSMALQEKYNQAAFERENERQDYLMQNAYSINKQALKEAGYSAADPNGTGLQAPATNSMDTPSGTQFQAGSTQIPDILGSVNSIISLREQLRGQRLANEAQEIENKYKEEKLNAEIGKTSAERKSIEFQNAMNDDVRPQLVETIAQTLSNLKKSGDLTDKQVEEATKNLSILDEQLQQQKIVTKHYDEKVVNEIEAIRQHMIAEVNNSRAALKNASANEKNAITQRLAYDLQKRITDLGEKGINVNPNVWQTVINMLTSGDADELIKGIIDSYHKVNALLYPDEQPKSMTEIALKNGNYLQAAHMLFFDLMMSLYPQKK